MESIKAAKRKKGWVKIERICWEARNMNIHDAWVDTCCVDKNSSAELTEAINSMYAYYREASLCVAYLEDLEPGDGPPTEEQLECCRWFARGWTLQELIAPRNVWFYDADWKFRCSTFRIPEAIIQQVNDLSIFAWNWIEAGPSQVPCGVLAPRPEAFIGTGTIELMDDLRLIRTRGGLVRNIATGLCAMKQSNVRFLEPVEVIMRKWVTRTIRRREMHYQEWDVPKVLVNMDLSGVKDYLNNRMLSVEFSVEAKHYPEHLFVPGHDCFRIDNNNPHFVGVVRIECLKRTYDEVGKDEKPPKEEPAFFWLVCGKSTQEGGETEIWATMYTKDIVESGLFVDVGIYHEDDLRNPLAISNIGNCLRNLRSGSGWGETTATNQQLTLALNRKPIEVTCSTSREGIQWDGPWDIDTQHVWKHYVHITAKDCSF